MTRSKTMWAGGAVALVAAAAAWYALKPSADEGAASGGAGTASQAFPWSRGAAADGAGADKPMVIVPGSGKVGSTVGKPDFLSDQEWADLQQALRDNPDREQEIARIVQYLKFQNQFNAWQALRNSPDMARRHALAEELLDQIPDRLKRSEMTAGEAAMLQETLLADIEPDAETRRQRLAGERKRLEIAPSAEQQAAQDRDAQRLKVYKEREAQIMAQWNATPPAQRSQQWLESQLDAARKAAFDAGR